MCNVANYYLTIRIALKNHTSPHCHLLEILSRFILINVVHSIVGNVLLEILLLRYNDNIFFAKWDIMLPVK